MNKKYYTYKELIIEPKNSDIIWRYITFAEFIYILEKKALFFVRVDKLKDEYEGSITKIDKEFQKEVMRNLKLSKDYFKDSNLSVRKSVAISSWHLNDYESVVMWNEHTNPEEGVVIQTTVADLRGFNNQFITKNNKDT